MKGQVVTFVTPLQVATLVLRHVPDLNGRVGTGNCQTLAVRMPSDDLSHVCTNRQVGDEFPVVRIVDGSEPRVLEADGQPAVVRVKGQGIRVPLLGQLPAVEFLTGRQVEAKDPTLLADGQLAAVWAESPPVGLPRFLAQHGCPVGHTPHLQRVSVFEVGQVEAVGAEQKNTPIGWSGDDVLDLPVVRQTADADDSLVAGAGIEPVLAIKAPTWIGTMPSRSDGRPRGMAR